MKDQSTKMINENARLSKTKPNQTHTNGISVQIRIVESHNNVLREMKEDTQSMK